MGIQPPSESSTPTYRVCRGMHRKRPRGVIPSTRFDAERAVRYVQEESLKTVDIDKETFRNPRDQPSASYVLKRKSETLFVKQ